MLKQINVCFVVLSLLDALVFMQSSALLIVIMDAYGQGMSAAIYALLGEQ